MKIVISSTNALKVAAIKEVIGKSNIDNPEFEAIAIDDDSVDNCEQPINQGTDFCCQNRDLYTREICNDEDALYFSLESGVYTTPEGIFDFCVLKVTGLSKITETYYSHGIAIDENLWKLYLRTTTRVIKEDKYHGCTTTFGDFLSVHFGVKNNNWMADPRFGGVDRKNQIMDVLHKWLIDYETEMIPDFPRPGVQFANIESITINPVFYDVLFNLLETFVKNNYDLAEIDYFAGLDARGFYFAPVLARVFGKGFLPIRKIKKVPRTSEDEIISESYTTEYSDDMFGLRIRDEYKRKKVVILDDLLATGGSLMGAIHLCEKANLIIQGCLCVYDVEGLRTAATEKLNVLDFATDSLINRNGVPNSFRQLVYPIPTITIKKIEHSLINRTSNAPRFTIPGWTYGSSDVYNNVKIMSSPKDSNLALSISKHLGVPVCKTKAGLFNNSESYVEINENVRNCHIIYVCSTRTGTINDDFMELLLFMDACNRSDVSKKTVILPYYPYSRSDKKDKPRTPIAAALMATLLKTQNIDHIISLDLHASQLQGLFGKGFHNLYIIDYMSEFLYQNYLKFYPDNEWSDHFVLVSPDAGAIKRTEAYGKKLGINYIILHKQRDYTNPGTVLKSVIVGEKDTFQGKIGIILDDMSDTMGTVCAASKVLVDFGLKEVIVGVTHGILSGPALDRINATPYIKEVIVTDSLPQEDNVSKCPKLRVLSSGELISRTVDSILTGKSVSVLFG